MHIDLRPSSSCLCLFFSLNYINKQTKATIGAAIVSVLITVNNSNKNTQLPALGQDMIHLWTLGSSLWFKDWSEAGGGACFWDRRQDEVSFLSKPCYPGGRRTRPRPRYAADSCLPVVSSNNNGAVKRQQAASLLFHLLSSVHFESTHDKVSNTEARFVRL